MVLWSPSCNRDESHLDEPFRFDRGLAKRLRMREVNATGQILTAPVNDYTKSLLAAVPGIEQINSTASEGSGTVRLNFQGEYPRFLGKAPEHD